MNTQERPQYLDVLQHLTPILYGLPPKIITIDGRAGSGKTTLGRFLAWRFNVSLAETDLFLDKECGGLNYHLDALREVIASRHDLPVLVEGVVVLRVLRQLGFKSDFHIRINYPAREDWGVTRREWLKYRAEFSLDSVDHMPLSLKPI